MHVWMALDPETHRVLMNPTEITRDQLPRGLRGEGWEIREGRVDPALYADVLAAQLSDEETDDFHRTAWTENGDTPWRPPPTPSPR